MTLYLLCSALHKQKIIFSFHFHVKCTHQNIHMLCICRTVGESVIHTYTSPSCSGENENLMRKLSRANFLSFLLVNFFSFFERKFFWRMKVMAVRWNTRINGWDDHEHQSRAPVRHVPPEVNRCTALPAGTPWRMSAEERSLNV